MNKFSRRNFLAMTGLGGAASLLLPSITAPATARAANNIPKRVVFYYMGVHGGHRKYWDSLKSEAMGPQIWRGNDWNLHPYHHRLAPYKSKINYFDNLDMASHQYDINPMVIAHSLGGTHCMTAASRSSDVDHAVGSISIDQALGQRINANTRVTPLSSLAVTVTGFGYDDVDLASGPGNRIMPVRDPRAIFATCFPQTGSTGTDPAQDLTLHRRSEVARLAEARYRALSQNLSSEDRTKLSQYADSLATFRQRLDLQRHDTLADRRPPSSILDSANDPALRWQDDFNANFSEDLLIRRDAIGAEVTQELVAAALHADVTRVATIVNNFDNEPSINGFGTIDGINVPDWHQFHHEVNNPESAAYENANVWNFINRQYDLVYARFQKFIDDLASRQESDGQSLLDHTAVVVVSQIASGGHSLGRLPWFTVGGLGGALKTDQYVRFERGGSNGNYQLGFLKDLPQGQSHADLFVTIGQGMGLSDFTSFGDSRVNKRALSEILVG